MPLGGTSSSNAVKRDIENIFVTGFEKRKKPRKHYVYVMVVSWTDRSRFEIYRRYSEFFAFQSTLVQLFPTEAKDKTIPSLPKRIFIGRSHVSKVAEARVDAINSYCQKLVTLDEKISGSIHMLTFFGPLPGDNPLEKLDLGRPASLHPLKIPTGNLWEEHCVVADFEKDSNQQLSVSAGSKVIVISKDDSGWWMAQHNGKSGWVPAAYLQPCTMMDEEDGTTTNDDKSYLGFVVEDASDTSSANTPSLDTELYRAAANYEAQEDGQISFDEDQLIHVIDKMDDGWWFVSIDQKEGWVPCSYLESVHPHGEGSTDSSNLLRASPLPPSSSSGHSSPEDQGSEGLYAATESYMAQESDEITLQQGWVVEVVKKSIEGWWTVNYQGQVGLFPAAFLHKHETKSYFLQVKNRKSGQSFYNKAPPPRRRTVRKTAERGRRKVIKKTSSPRPLRKTDKSGTSSSSESDYNKHEIADKHSTDDGHFWGRKPVASRVRSSSINSDSSNESSKASRENSPETTDTRRNVDELKGMFAKTLSTDELPTGGKFPRNLKKVSPEDKPVMMRAKPHLNVTDHDSPNVPLRPRQSEIFRAHFANAFTNKTNTTSSMSPVEELEESQTVVSKGKARKTPPPTPPRKDSSSPETQRKLLKPTMPDVPPKHRSNSIDPHMTTSPDQLPRSQSQGDAQLQDKAMEAILKVLIQKNGPELQDLVKQAIASDPDLLKLALSDNN